MCDGNTASMVSRRLVEGITLLTSELFVANGGRSRFRVANKADLPLFARQTFINNLSNITTINC